MYKVKQIPYSVFLFLLFINCSGTEEIVIEEKDDNPDIPDIVQENVTVEKKFDSKSATYYYLTKIDHKDKNGNLLALEHEFANIAGGLTTLEFALKKENPLLAINASPNSRPIRYPNGVHIIDGEVIQEGPTSTYTLGIKDSNLLVSFDPGTTGQEMLDTGVNDALSAFIPLVEDHEPVSEDILTRNDVVRDKHPRQIIAQLDNLDLLILSCGGRGFDGEGMTSKDLVRILMENDVKFAFMLDGGGSTSTVINGKQITKQIDGNGTKDRPRTNFLYIE